MSQTLLGLTADDMLQSLKHVSVDVSNQSTLVLPESQNRRYVLLINDSQDVMYVSFGQPAQLHCGIRLERDGGYVQFSLCMSSMCGNAIYAIQANQNTRRLLATEGC